MHKKLQVFISSTYEDMRDERQAAVEAVLRAGHIPAGMELFTAGDQSQMEVIRQWIEESDVFLLMLGARYGSIEPTSGKSYIHLEYEHALAVSKPRFAVVAKDPYNESKVKRRGSKAVEQTAKGAYDKFKKDLLDNKICHFFESTAEIKLSVFQSLNDLERRENLVGWARGNRVSSNPLPTEELARLSKENEGLREQILTLSAALRTESARERFGNFTYAELETALTATDLPSLEYTFTNTINALDALLKYQGILLRGIGWRSSRDDVDERFARDEVAPVLAAYELALYHSDDEGSYYKLTPDGLRLAALARLKRAQRQAASQQ